MRLDPMTWDEYDDFVVRSVDGFADRLVSSGLMPADDAVGYARRQLAGLLPAGLATPLHLLRNVREVSPASPVVGHLWLRVGPVEPPATGVEAYVFDVELVGPARGRGLGTATMLAAEQAARDLGAGSIRLTVFAGDEAARRMYARLGYRPVATDVTAQLLAKDL